MSGENGYRGVYPPGRTAIFRTPHLGVEQGFGSGEFRAPVPIGRVLDTTLNHPRRRNRNLVTPEDILSRWRAREQVYGAGVVEMRLVSGRCIILVSMIDVGFEQDLVQERKTVTVVDLL